METSESRPKGGHVTSWKMLTPVAEHVREFLANYNETTGEEIRLNDLLWARIHVDAELHDRIHVEEHEWEKQGWLRGSVGVMDDTDLEILSDYFEPDEERSVDNWFRALVRLMREELSRRKEASSE